MITIGTDCSGIEAPIQALKQLRIPFRHLWSCEKDKYCLESIKANYNPEKIYTNIFNRDHKLLPDVDIYVCGFPCQPFSTLGKLEGEKKKNGKVIYECLKVINEKKPKIIILENVKNFITIENGLPFKKLISALKKINHNNKKIYNVYYDILNTKDYGIPQQRNRLYIICIMKSIEKNSFKFPNHKKLKPLKYFLSDTKIHDREKSISSIKNKTLIKNINKYKNEDYIITANNYYASPVKGICPTLTTNIILYLLKYNRFLNIKEYLCLQGFNSNFKRVVSEHQLKKQIGNSMSVNVLKELFKCIFKAID